MYTRPEQRADTGQCWRTVILICGSYFFDRKYTKILLWSIFAVSFFVMPEIRLFCPVLIYILVREQETVTTLSGGVLGTIILIKNDTSLPIMTTILLIIEALAWILATDAIKCDKMYFEIRRIKDDSEERTLLLAEKNKALQKNKIMKFMRQHFVRETELPAKSMIM